MDQKLKRQREQKRLWAKKNYEKNKEKIKQRKAEYYKKNKEQILSSNREKYRIKKSNIPPKPRGRPPKILSPEKMKIKEDNERQIAYYTDFVRKGILPPDIDQMNLEQVKNLTYAVAREQKRLHIENQRAGVYINVSKKGNRPGRTDVEGRKKTFIHTRKMMKGPPYISIDTLVYE